MMRTGLFFVALMASTSCVVGAPPGFSKGTNWTIPLMGTHMDGSPVTSVMIGNKGPYLFRVSLDSHSIIDMKLMRELDLFENRTGGKLIDGSDSISHEQIIYADIPRIQIGDLTVERRKFIAMKTDATYNGRPVLGTIGRDIISETLVWHLDRDRGVLRLATRGNLSPPSNAIPIKGSSRFNQFFTKIRMANGTTVELVADFTGPSQLWAERANAADLPQVTEFTDFYGRRLRANHAWRARSIWIGDNEWNQVVFLPFGDRRVDNLEYHGRLGGDFWSRFNLTVDWHMKTIWVQPRERDAAATVTARLHRWAPSTGCQTPGCATLDTDIKTISSTTADGQTLDRSVPRSIAIQRDGHQGKPLELIIEALDANGERLARRSRLLIVLPGDIDQMTIEDPRLLAPYTGAAGFRIADMSPFPPTCEAANGCVTRTR